MIKKYDYIIYCFLRDCMVSDCRFKGLVSPEKKSESMYHLLSAMAHKNKLRFYVSFLLRYNECMKEMQNKSSHTYILFT